MCVGSPESAISNEIQSAKARQGKAPDGRGRVGKGRGKRLREICADPLKQFKDAESSRCWLAVTVTPLQDYRSDADLRAHGGNHVQPQWSGVRRGNRT